MYNMLMNVLGIHYKCVWNVLGLCLKLIRKILGMSMYVSILGMSMYVSISGHTALGQSCLVLKCTFMLNTNHYLVWKLLGYYRIFDLALL